MKQRLLLLLAFLTLFASSCTHKELFYDQLFTVNLKVVFDWKNAPNVNHETMSLYLFPSTGGESLRYEFVDINGGTIKIPLGSYAALCLNSDTESILFQEINRYDRFVIDTRNASLLESLGVRSNNIPRAEGSENERVAASPDLVNSDRIDQFTLSRTEMEQTLVLYPDISVSNFTYEIRNAENLQYTSALSGSISGMVGGLFLGKNQRTEEPVTIPFEAISDGDSTVSGGFRSFGANMTSGRRNKLVIYAVLSDGSKRYYTFDVTDQIRSAPDQRNVHILLNGLPLPKPLVNGGGFQPDVDDWADVNIDIKFQ